MNKTEIDKLCEKLDLNAKRYSTPEERFVYLEAVYEFKQELYNINKIKQNDRVTTSNPVKAPKKK